MDRLFQLNLNNIFKLCSLRQIDAIPRERDELFDRAMILGSNSSQCAGAIWYALYTICLGLSSPSDRIKNDDYLLITYCHGQQN